MKKTIKIIFLLITINSFGQEITFIKDEIMDNYMKSGYATQNFIPNGVTDNQNQKQGIWKDYEVIKDFTCINNGLKPKQVFGTFLLYGEGSFVNDKRNGKWIFYTIEDQTFKKLIQKEVIYNNGVLEGEFKYFYPNEKLAMIGQFKNNELDGVIKSFHINGELYGTRFYKNGLKDGKHIYIYSNGKIELVHSFVNGIKDGLYQLNYPNGNIQEKFNYKMGKEDGVYQYFYDNGQLWIEKTYSNDLLLNVKGNYSKDGKSRDKGTLENGNGTVKYYTEEGKIYLIITFKNGMKINEQNF
jgi:antitoxin component YwqK of YwqJK toxin-antitoxin module